MVIMPSWVRNVLFLQCVGVRGTPVGVVAPVGVANLVGGSAGRSGWLSLVSHWEWLWCHQISARRLPRGIRDRV